MESVIREIIKTPLVVIENDLDEDFPELLVLRRTGCLTCMYCDCRWADFMYVNVSRNRVCYNCRDHLINGVSQIRRNLNYISGTIFKKSKVLEDVIEVGMNPARIYQTQLIDTLHLFKQPTN